MATSFELVSKGRRNLACAEILQAVENLQKACELLATEFGDLDERLADPNLLYGTALLELARMESTVIGNALEGVPVDNGSSESEAEYNVVEIGPEMTADEKEELSNQVIDAMCEEEPVLSDATGGEQPTGANVGKQTEGTACQKEATTREAESEKLENNAKEDEEKLETVEPDASSDEADMDDAKNAVEENSGTEGEPNGSDAETEDVTNLQLAWEVIEVARKIFSRKDDSKSRLKVAECYEKLGEISREKEDYDQALSDLQECLALRQALLPEDSREVAETHFQIGTTHAVAGNLELAIAAFGGAATTLRKHAKTLTACITEKEESQDESELEILRGSLKEVESLIPEVEKRRAEILEDLQISKANPGTSTLSTSTAVTNGDRKPADDISHLIRKKRQVNESAEVHGGSTEPNGEASSPKTKKIKVAEAADKDLANHDREAQPQPESYETRLCRMISDDPCHATTTASANATNVVNFYDSAARSITANSLAHREQTRIYHLRNFNNWIKSIFINQYLEKLRQDQHPCILDLCCGKGGDQLKWAQSNAKHVTFVDISSASIETCRQRYDHLRRKYQRSIFTADFHVADCTADLRKSISIQPSRYDLVSCQFSFHYAFESVIQTRTFLANVNYCLRQGGYFIATIPNAYEVVRRAKNAYDKVHQCLTGKGDSVGEIRFGNSVYSIRFPSSSYSVICDGDQESKSTSLRFPLFGSRYDFQLESVVDCPEFLVYPPLLNKLASEYNLIPVAPPLGFAEFFYRYHSVYVGQTSSRDLLLRMKALETYPNWVQGEDERRGLAGSGEPGAYDHVFRKVSRDKQCAQSRYLGTLSLAEWEAITLYSLIAFQKK